MSNIHTLFFLPLRSPTQRYADNLAALRVLQVLAIEKRQATETERQTLALYSGWGDTAVRKLGMMAGVPSQNLINCLQMPDDEPSELKLESTWWSDVVSPQLRTRVEQIRRSSLNAHYTDPELAAATWSGLVHMGLGDLRAPFILEPSAGVGRFLSAMPLDQMDTLFERITAIEMEEISASILKYLHPGINACHAPFETVVLPAVFDVVIGNVPFGDYQVSDSNLPDHGQLPSACRTTIHDYFICRSVSLLRPGGVAALITSTGTMDKKDATARKWLHERAELLGAFRLAGDAHASAGTEVTTDVLFFRRREGLPTETPEWVNEGVDVEFTRVNVYWAMHPSHVMGEWCLNKLYGSGVGVRRRAGDPRSAAQALADAVRSLPAGALKPLQKHAPNASRAALVGAGDLAPTTPLEASLARVLRAIRRVAADPEDKAARTSLEKTYQTHRAAYGPIRTCSALRKHHDSRWWPLVASLERKDGQVSTAVQVRQDTVVPSTAMDAVYLLLDRTGEFTPETVAELLGSDAVSVCVELRGQIFQEGPNGQWFTRDQYLSGDVVGKLETAREWATVDITWSEHVQVLEGVQPEPVKISDAERGIAVPFGAPWVPASVYLDFLRYLFPAYSPHGVELSYAQEIGSWTLQVDNAHLLRSIENIQTLATKRMTALELIACGLDLRLPVVRDEELTSDGVKTVKNPVETELAQAKLQEIRERWTAWIPTDAVRVGELEKIYNYRYNRMRARRYDGTKVQFPGLVKEWQGRPFNLRPHQAMGALRLMERSAPDNTCLVTYAPGLGKTLVGICGAMKRIQAGLTRKAVVVVPANVLHQWADLWCEIYPMHADWVLVGTDRAFASRRRFLVEAAIGGARVILLTYEQFRTIPIEPATFSAYLTREVQDLEEALERVDKNDPSQRGLERAFKQRQRSLANFEAKYKDRWAKVIKAGDADVAWEKWGVDMLMCDESHFLKNDSYISKLEGVSGMPRSESQRALDARIKMHYVTTPELFPGLNELPKEGKGVGLTGTPVTNSLVETWIAMRLFQPRLLRKLGMWHFDSWTGTFTTQVQAPEMDAAGQWRVRTRLRFHNLSELQDLLGLNWERVDPKEVGGSRPRIVGERMRVIETEGSAELRAYTAELADRAEQVRKRKVDPVDDNMLKITHDGRVASVFNGQPSTKWPTDRVTKIDALVREVWQMYCHSDAAQGVQLIFCDLFTPKVSSDTEPARGDDPVEIARANKLRSKANKLHALSDPKRNDNIHEAAIAVVEAAKLEREAANAEIAARVQGGIDLERDFEERGIYGIIRDRLIVAGMLPREVAFIHDATTDVERAELYRRVNCGEVRVLIGSTQRLSIGVNVQERAYAAHHLTVPWRPDWLEQANKRIDRDGNTLDEVHIVCYVTTGSYDVCLWQLIEIKAQFVAAIGSGTVAGRTADDIGDLMIDATTAKAVALGDLRVIEKVKLELALHTLARQYRTWKTQNIRSRMEIQELPVQIKEKTQEIEDLRTLMSHRDNNQLRSFSAKIARVAGAINPDRSPAAWDLVADRSMADMRIHALAESLRHRLSDGMLVGQYRGLDLIMTRDAKGVHIEARHRISADADVGSGGGYGACASAQNVGVRGSGCFAQIEAQLASLETVTHRLQVQVDILEKRLANLRTNEAIWSHMEDARSSLTRYNDLCDAVATAGIVDRHHFRFD